MSSIIKLKNSLNQIEQQINDYKSDKELDLSYKDDIENLKQRLKQYEETSEAGKNC